MAVGALLALRPALADTLLSDRVVLMEADGRTHIVQHTLFSDAVLTTLAVPGSVIPQRVAFGGPERLTFQSAWEARPEQLALWSGSAFARYRHQYGDAVQRLSNGAWQLSVSSLPPGLSIEPSEATGGVPVQIDLASTWIFPGDVDVLDWQAGTAADGNWTFEDNSLGWQQRGAEPVALTITYRSRSNAAPVADSFAPASSTGDTTLTEERIAERRETQDDEVFVPPSNETRGDGAAGATDADGDGVPDAADVCIGPVKVALTESNVTDEADMAPLPGCEGAIRVVLEGIGFDVGQSWLDQPARRVLDRVAAALIRVPGRAFEIAAHTDSQGRWTNNLALSQRRARAVRQYLLLRGVPAGSLSATGHGESRPISDNLTAQGRRENRRIELGPLPPNAPDED